MIEPANNEPEPDIAGIKPIAKPKRRGSQVKKGMVIIGTMMEDTLYQRLLALDAPHGKRHALYEALVLKWVDARADRLFPRAFLGFRRAYSKQRSYYFTEATGDLLRKIADEDGVQPAQVLRTALAWSVAPNVSTSDTWDTEGLFGPRTPFRPTQNL